MSIRTFIVDDEQDSIDVVKIMLAEKCSEVEVIGFANDANEAIEKIQLLKPDLVLLDIEMSGKNGFDVLKALKGHPLKVIFISGYEQYALQAIKVSAIDFVLKPVDTDELEAAIEKVKASFNVHDDRLNHFGQIMQKSTNALKKIVIPTAKGFHTIPFDQIESIEAQSGNYCVFKLSEGRQDLVTKPLNYFEEILPPEQFFRTHRSYLVNLSKVAQYDSKTGALLMESSFELEVAVRRRSEFRKHYQKK